MTFLLKACRDLISRAQRLCTAEPKTLRRKRLRAQSALPAIVECLEPRKLLTVTFGGGPLLANVQVQGVYLGADWQNVAATHTQQTQLEGFNSSIVAGAYMDMLTSAGYGVGRGTAAAGYIDPLNLNKTSYLQDSQIQAELQAQITAGHLQAPNANRLYVVYVEPGVAIRTSDGATSINTFLGYHDSFTGRTASGSSINLYYAVIAYPGGRNPTSSSQGFATDLDEMTDVASHELGEAVTDPIPGLGWYDFNLDGEIGDLTNLGYSSNLHVTRLNGYLVQNLVNKNDQLIAPVTTTNITAPTISVKVTSTSTVSISWQAVTGATGYTVLQLIKGAWTQVGTVTSGGSGTISTSISNQTAGSQATFSIKAYNATSQATSTAITVTLPTSNPLTAPTNVMIKQTSATTATLTWSPGANATGYAIYYWTGARWAVWTNLSSSSRSTTLTGLKAGSVYYFQVVATNGTSSVAQQSYVTLLMR